MPICPCCGEKLSAKQLSVHKKKGPSKRTVILLLANGSSQLEIPNTTSTKKTATSKLSQNSISNIPIGVCQKSNEVAQSKTCLISSASVKLEPSIASHEEQYPYQESIYTSSGSSQHSSDNNISHWSPQASNSTTEIFDFDWDNEINIIEESVMESMEKALEELKQELLEEY
ncbi:hypothetical protein M422DRAFT_53485 [Sphaerobolus stellatus SS14]|uniref:Uncharacterized protein n=1 Tax=Sphaerobolus stellatus (strain SS14) TaxID=990650 RepID=A0A0C9V0Q6_SPHS4|nr:hypothetical protein M422DRAFT_53485 [Sphaerobolus stellatus SS14]